MQAVVGVGVGAAQAPVDETSVGVAAGGVARGGGRASFSSCPSAEPRRADQLRHRLQAEHHLTAGQREQDDQAAPQNLTTSEPPETSPSNAFTAT